MGKRENDRAKRENSMNAFLIECCEEGPGLETQGVEVNRLYNLWRKHYDPLVGPVQPRATRNSEWIPVYLKEYEVYETLRRLGFTSESRWVNAGGKQARVVFKGFRIKYVPSPPPTPLIAPSNNTEPANPAVSVAPKSSLPTVKLANGISINGSIYDIRLISTLKRVSPFIKKTFIRNSDGSSSREQQSEIQVTHLVTFHNPELRHQWVDQYTAQLIAQQLGIQLVS